jgi:hypothetical protein
MFPLFRRVTLGVGLALILSLVVLSAQGTDPLVGTWKLNVAASTYSPGPPPNSSTRTVEDYGGGLFVSTGKGVNAKGDPTWAHFAFRYDGKDYPYAGSTSPGTSPTFTTVAFKRVDANTFEATAKVDGKVAATTMTTTISKDGKTYTTRTKGTNAQGQPVNNVAVFDKQ